MPMIELEDKDGNIRWITVLPFNDLALARSYSKSSSGGLRIVKKVKTLFIGFATLKMLHGQKSAGVRR